MRKTHSSTPPTWREMLGVESSRVSHRERLISALGGCLGVIVVFLLCRALPGATEPLLVLSIGSTAVLLFAAPHAQFAQVWPVFGGHLASALVGVACARWVPDTVLAAGLAVGLAIGAMHYLRCIHPPAGATALAAVLGGESLRALGFGFVLAPVLLNVAIMLVVAVAFNAWFPWRRYPLFLARRDARAQVIANGHAAIAHEDFVYALAQIDSFIDVSEDDLLRIYQLATGRHAEAAARAVAINPAERP